MLICQMVVLDMTRREGRDGDGWNVYFCLGQSGCEVITSYQIITFASAFLVYFLLARRSIGLCDELVPFHHSYHLADRRHFFIIPSAWSNLFYCYGKMEIERAREWGFALVCGG